MRRVVVGLLCIALLSAGCTKRVRAAAPYIAGDEPVVAYAKHTGVWKIKAAIDDDDKPEALPATERLVEKGEPIGFRTDETTGRVIAFIGDEEVYVPDRPGLQRYEWSYNHKRRTQFGKEMSKARQSLRDTAKVVAVVGLVGAVIYLEAVTDDDHCDR